MWRRLTMALIDSQVAVLVTGCTDAGETPPAPRVESTVAALVSATVAAVKNSDRSPSAPPSVGATRSVAPRTPQRTPTAVPTPVTRLQSQLPREVYEEFVDSFYGGCVKPSFDGLGIAASWSRAGSGQFEFTPPVGTYFLVLIASPSSLASWRFDSVLEGQRGCRFQSLQLDSTVPDELSDAQRWCAVGGGVRVPNVLHVQTSGLSWTVHLVIPEVPSR